MESGAQKQEVDGKQRVPHFYGDKGVLMNLNHCPPGIYHKGRNRKEQIGVQLFFLSYSQTVFQAHWGAPNFAITKMAVFPFANCRGSGLCQGSEQGGFDARGDMPNWPELLLQPTRSFICPKYPVLVTSCAQGALDVLQQCCWVIVFAVFL